MTYAVTLLVIGLILIFFEILLPGMVLGALAVLLIGGSVAVAYIQTDYGHLFLGIALLSITGFTFWFVLVFPITRFGKKLTSQTTVGDLGINHESLLDQQGEAYTDLRPSGKANINEQRFDVVTEGVFLEKGDPLRVVAIEGQRIVVRKV